MNELREPIDELKGTLYEEEPLDYDAEAAVEERLAAHDAAVAAGKELAEAEQDDPEELLAADAKVLGTTTDKLRDLDIAKSYAQVRLRPISERPSRLPFIPQVSPTLKLTWS